MHPLPRQISHLADLSCRYPTSFQLASLQQFGNPLCILGIGLMPVQTLDMLRIHQDQLVEVTFEQVPYRAPILACRFHRNLGDFAVLQPCPELFQIAREGAEVPLAHFHFWLTHGRQHADRHALLVYVDAATEAILWFHSVPSDHRAKDARSLLWEDIPTRVHPPEGWRRQFLVPVSAS